tara:strand:+ start:876 stop:1295 length:420 start_codon:yes stop_codon:yes gene_type:complete
MVLNAFNKNNSNAATLPTPRNMSASVKSDVKSVSYSDWKEQNKSKKLPVLAIATTAGTGGVRIYDHILYPQEVNKVKTYPPKTKPLHRDVGVQTKPQHDIIMYTSRSKPPFMSWRFGASGNDCDSDEEPYFQVTQSNSD